MTLPDYFAAQFDNSYRYQSYSNWIKIIGFLVNFALIIFSILFNEFFELTWVVIVILIFSIVALVVEEYYMKKSIEEHEKGEKIRKIHILDYMFNSKIEDPELEYLLLGLENWVKNKAKEKKKKREERESSNSKTRDSSTNFSNDETDQKAKRITYIQQNCFETSQYLRIYYEELNTKLRIGLILFSITLIVIWVGFILKDSDLYSSTQLIIASFNFLFALNIFRYISRYKLKYDQLKELDKTLQLIKYSSDESDFTYYFSEYNSILVDKPVTPERIFNNNWEEIGNRWKRESSKKKI